VNLTNGTNTTNIVLSDDKTNKPLIIGIVLGVGIPMLFVLLIAVAYCCFCRRHSIDDDFEEFSKKEKEKEEREN
jgi:hypothetical protein